MMFGLTSAHAAGAIAMVMVGMKLEVAPGEYLVNDNMLNGVVMMILVTCVISTLMTEHAAQQLIVSQRSQEPLGPQSRTDDEKILICVKYPEIAPQLLSQALLVRNQRLNREVIALNVVYDDERANAHREEGQRLLEGLQRQASASEVRLETQVRLASNIANGIKHAFREAGCSEVIMGMHVHTSQNAKFWGDFIQSLYNGLNRQIML
jgi:K+-sensing histidine kinase KdpD